MEKPQLINFIAKVMEDSGFKVYKNFKTSQDVVDIYAVLPTTLGDFGVVVACENYDKEVPVGVDVLKEMESIGKSLNASKVTIVTSSFFNDQATSYGLRKNIKLVDRQNLLEMAKKYSDEQDEEQEDADYEDYIYDDYDMDYFMEEKENTPVVYKRNSLYKQEENNSFFSRLFNNRPSSQAPSTLYNYNPNQNTLNIYEILKPILGNPIVLIILVVLISYLIAYGLGSFGIDGAMIGLVEMIVALILSYAFTFFFAQRNRFFIVRGSVIFFISLIILIILILLF